jgi:hypothetical protein
MTLDVLLDMLLTHQTALKSGVWPRPHGPTSGPALFLDEADTRAAILELMRLKREVVEARAWRSRQVGVNQQRTEKHGLRAHRASWRLS